MTREEGMRFHLKFLACGAALLAFAALSVSVADEGPPGKAAPVPGVLDIMIKPLDGVRGVGGHPVRIEGFSVFPPMPYMIGALSVAGTFDKKKAVDASALQFTLHDLALDPKHRAVAVRQFSKNWSSVKGDVRWVTFREPRWTVWAYRQDPATGVCSPLGSITVARDAKRPVYSVAIPLDAEGVKRVRAVGSPREIVVVACMDIRNALPEALTRDEIEKAGMQMATGVRRTLSEQVFMRASGRVRYLLLPGTVKEARALAATWARPWVSLDWDGLVRGPATAKSSYSEDTIDLFTAPFLEAAVEPADRAKVGVAVSVLLDDQIASVVEPKRFLAFLKSGRAKLEARIKELLKTLAKGEEAVDLEHGFSLLFHAPRGPHAPIRMDHKAIATRLTNMVRALDKGAPAVQVLDLDKVRDQRDEIVAAWKAPKGGRVPAWQTLHAAFRLDGTVFDHMRENNKRR